MEAGLVFAAAMAIGILATLAAVALLTVFMRDGIVRFAARHGASMQRLTRFLDGAAGALLIILRLRGEPDDG